MALAITMWDFSWLERRWPGAGYGDWDAALAGLRERGYDAVRIDAYPHLIATDPGRTWTLLPEWTTNDWGAPARVRVAPWPALAGFLHACRRHGIRAGLSTWFRQDVDDHRLDIATARAHAQVWIRTLELVEREGLLGDLLYVDLCNEWPLANWAPFFKGAQGAGDWVRPGSLAWMREAVGLVRGRFPGLPLTVSVTGDHRGVEGADVSFLDLLEPHLWMATTSDFYERVGYRYERFETRGYENLVARGEALYRADPEHWQAALADGIDRLAAWSRGCARPLITTECWGVVDYKDWPGLDWGWVKELCALGTCRAAATGRWRAIATSNFCGPQFRGMWDDIGWHRALTGTIHASAGP
ncbi:MAG: hypothetical protein RLZZ127_952 [Planctomycetota bacterium]|jgi:hypothetical protein